jgi:D-tyrosyl-tRNA(Tyr) deacylase
MKVVVQRVSEAQVAVAGEVAGRIEAGLLVLLGIQAGDVDEDVRWLAEKVASLRIFEDADGRMNRSVKEAGGRILVVSQFTLIASTRKGARPSFNDAAKPDIAIPLYESFVRHLEAALGAAVATGRFGAMMKVSLVNDGPVTLIIDSRARE